MKHKLRFLFLLLLFLTAARQVLVAMQFSLVNAAPQFWVSLSGNDATGTGSSNAPWATISKARDYISSNRLNENMAADITVNITPGEYLLTNALTFNPSSSGSNGRFIVYRAAEGPDTVNLVGSADINGWTPSTDDIWRINVGVNKTVLTMYENNVRGRLARSTNYVFNARYPQAQAPYHLSVDGGYDSVSGRDWLQYNPGEFSISNFTSTAQVTWWTYGGYCDWGMASPALFSNNATAEKLYFTRTSSNSPPGFYSNSDRYFVAGIQSFLDAPGEFYYSKTDGWLYYYPRAGGNPDGQDMRVPVSGSTTLISVAGTSPGTHAHHLKFEGLTLTYTSYGTEAGALDFKSTDHIEVRNCHIRNVGRAAILMSNDNDHNLAYGCWIEHCGVGGIWVKNYLNRITYPDNKSEFNIISNCKIHDLGEVTVNSLLTAGVVLFDTSDCEVSHCDIYNSPRYAISLRGHWSTQRGVGNEDDGHHFSKNNTFKYIRATDCMQDSGDGAIMHAAHCNGTNGATGGGPGGCINYWKDILISGAYADPSVLDWAPNGIFFDHPNSCLYQNISNIQIDWVQGQNDAEHPTNTGPYRGNRNPFTNQVSRNVSWTNDSSGNAFSESLMDYARIGLKPDFPSVYDPQTKLIADDHTLDYTESGTGWEETMITDLCKGDGRYHNTGTSAQSSRWLPVFPFTRNYEVSVWKMNNYTNASSEAPYIIYHKDGSASVAVNQQTGTAGWVSVGTYPFAAGRDATNGAVKLFANTTDDKQVRADAVKFTEAGLLTNGVLGGEKGWWGFDFTNTDSSGFGHTATLHNVGYSTLYKIGSSSAHFNGTNAYANVADHPDIDIGTGDFAISLWFRRDANIAGNLHILSKGAEHDTDTGYCVYGSDTTVTFALCNGTSRRMLTGTHSGTNAWNHLAVNISRSGYMTLYINGMLAKEMNISDWNGLDISNSRNLNIGRSVTSGTLNWAGRIDDVAVFQRVLSEKEIGL